MDQQPACDESDDRQPDAASIAAVEETPPEQAPKLALPESVGLEILVVLSVGFIPALSLWLIRLTGHATQGPISSYPYWLDAVTHALAVFFELTIVLYILSRSGESWNYFGVEWPRGSDVPLGVALLCGLFLVWAMWWAYADPLYAILGGEDAKGMMPRTVPDYLFCVPMAAIGVLFEEVLFRGYLIARFTSIFRNPLESIVVSAVLFGLIHAQYSVFVIIEMIVTFGIPMGVFYYLSHRLWPCVIAHFGWNMSLYLRALE